MIVGLGFNPAEGLAARPGGFAPVVPASSFVSDQAATAPSMLDKLEAYAGQHGAMLSAGGALLGYGFYARNGLAKLGGALAIGYVAYPVVAIFAANAWSRWGSRP